MDYKIGSLANLISGTHPSKSTSKCEGNIHFVTVEPTKIEKGNKRANDSSTQSTEGNIKKTKIQNSEKCEHQHQYQESLGVNASSALKRIERKNQPKKVMVHDEEKELRTVFVGNLPNNINKVKLKKLFGKFGTVENVRFRCPPLSDPRISKKVTIIKSRFHPDRSNINAYVCFQDAESARKATMVNGMVFNDHHLRIDLAHSEGQHDQKKAIFVGNVPFAAEEDDLWKVFESCGTIVSIRIVRDKKTGIGMGFAYINYESIDGVELALNLDGEKVKDRELRVTRAVKKAPVKIKQKWGPAKFSSPKQNKKGKKTLNTVSGTETKTRDSVTGKKIKTQEKLTIRKPNLHFQGQKMSDGKKQKKKKKKITRVERKKNAIKQMLAASLNTAAKPKTTL